ncbi:MAG: recombinase family protein [Planctomycetota bacterium]|jgi:DNA-directed RNA polymerase subunit RPC12/RpoP
MRKAICYIRSCARSGEENPPIAVQEEDCRSWCARKGYYLAHVFHDSADPDRSIARQALLQALDYAIRNKVDLFLVWKIERLSRNVQDFHLLRAKLSRWGIRIASAHDPSGDDPAVQYVKDLLDQVALDEDLHAFRTERDEAQHTPVAPGPTPAFPLRGYVLCARCSRPLTASYTKGLAGRKNPYYRCPRCRGTQTRKKTLEESFAALLEDLRFSSEVLLRIRKQCEDRFGTEILKKQRELLLKKKEVLQMGQRREGLEDLYLDGSLSPSEYQEKVNQLELRIFLSEMDQREIEIEKIDLESAVNHVVNLFDDPAKGWREEKSAAELIARLIFADPPSWDGKKFLPPKLTRSVWKMPQKRTRESQQESSS